MNGDFVGAALSGQEIHEYCVAWREWCFTRRFFIKPGSKNILSRMQPSKVRLPPDAIMSDELSFLNMAIHALVDMDDSDADCFLAYYWDQSKNIKKVAADMKIHRDTFYERKSRFARKAYSMSLSIKRVHEESIRDVAEAVLID
ncbi:hypothetical protein [Herbaspirillum sp. ST 5-3]|uniref:hypothetical protein n=1 Tax=Oxalobacteraceae TaxID=75682 RepID=UPI0010A4B16F|nr:hypothetical protein [Herbaspirillum sp. ST 5-3]